LFTEETANGGQARHRDAGPAKEESAARDNVGKLVDHLFRHEAGKMVSVLTGTFGTENLDLVEDVVQDALVKASQVWPVRGIPDDPSAWLYQAAKNGAIDLLRRGSRTVRLGAMEEAAGPEASMVEAIDNVWEEELVKDDMLRMMFVCCHPALPVESQITLILKTLCGFSTAEVARSFLAPEDTISKRLYRAKETFRRRKIAFALPSADELKSRTEAVLNSIYLLFNEGYNSSDERELIRSDLMEEALLLGRLLTENPITQVPETFALMALMCFQSSRTGGRLSPEGDIVLLEQQDRGRWDFRYIAAGSAYMERAASGDTMSAFHLEAAIAFEHCVAPSFDETNWRRILELYDWLDSVAPSPVARLNRTVAVMQLEGPEAALRALDEIPGRETLEKFYLYHSLRGEMLARLHAAAEARACFEAALRLTGSASERALLMKKIDKLEEQRPPIAAAG